jgi:hypothetical protein
MKWTDVLKDIVDNHRQYSNTDLHQKLTLMYSLIPDTEDVNSPQLNEIIRSRFPQLVKTYSINKKQ